MTGDRLTHRIPIVKNHLQIDERSLLLARAIVRKIDSDPKREGLSKARRTCRRWAGEHGNPYIREWSSILEGPWPLIRERLLDPSEAGTALRQTNPFAGVLSPRERWALYREYGKRHDP